MTPSEIIRSRAAKVTIVEDDLGRKIGVRWLGPLGRVTLARIVGSEDQGNPEIAAHYAAAYSVDSIDGQTFPVPQNISELNVMLERLDEEGVMAAVRSGMKNRVDIRKQVADKMAEGKDEGQAKREIDAEETASLKLVRAPELRNALKLVNRGVPFDVAFSLAEDEAVAWLIIFGELEGGRWNFDAMNWEQRD